MLVADRSIAIIGAGPGGLTLARLLQMQGAAIKVYERDIDKNARVQGSPLDMHEGSGMTALRRAGLEEAFTKQIRHGADKKLIVDKNLEIFFSDHQDGATEAIVGSRFRPEIDRGALRKVLLASLQPGAVVWDSHFISMEKRGAGWLLNFKNGTSAYADIVIAADGANSRLRPYVTGTRAFYSGITMLEINVYDAKNRIPYIHDLLNGGKIMAFGDEHCMLGGQKGDGDLGFYASFKTSKTWAAGNDLDYNSNAQLLHWFKQEYAGWGSDWFALFEQAATPFIPRPIYCMPLDQDWPAQPNITLLGDAAHVMPPFAGEGANTAMLDAMELGEALTSDHFGTLQEAIAFYETRMRERAAKAAQASLINGEKMHSAGALQAMLNVFAPQ